MEEKLKIEQELKKLKVDASDHPNAQG